MVNFKVSRSGAWRQDLLLTTLVSMKHRKFTQRSSKISLCAHTLSGRLPVRISRETDYAIRVLLALARQGHGVRQTTGAIREVMAIPPLMAPRVVARLAQLGLITSIPGRGGGIELTRAPETITLKEIVTALEPDFFIAECLVDPDLCPFETTCPVRRQWARIQALVLRELEHITLADLAAENDGSSTVLSLAASAEA